VKLWKSAKATPSYVHFLVLTTFVGPRPKGMEACHGNGDCFDNHLSNLRWDTPVNNHADKRKHGTLLVGLRNPNTKLSAKDKETIAHRLKLGDKQQDIADDFNVSQSLIAWIKKCRHILT
jgi:hypothetical protein